MKESKQGLRDMPADLKDRVLNAVSGRNLMEHTRRIASRERLSGSPEEAIAFDYIESESRKAGAEVRRCEGLVLLSIPKSARLSVGEGGRDLACHTHSASASTPPGGVDLPLADCREVQEDSRRDGGGGGASGRAPSASSGVRGAAALIGGMARPEKVAWAMDRGATACIFLVDADTPPEMVVSPVWGSPGLGELSRYPSISVISIGRQAGGVLLEEMARSGGSGRLTVHVETVVDTGWRKAPCLVAEVKAGVSPFVLVSGHVDSWYMGAMDNASGNAAMLEIMRIAVQHRDRLARDIRFAFWSGHSHGRYAGSTWYVDRFWNEISENAVVHINVDCLGARNASVMTEANAMPETRPVARRVVAGVTGDRFRGSRFSRSGDQSFWGPGVPSLFSTLSAQPPEKAGAEAEGQRHLFGGTSRSGGLGPWWHTPADTVDVVSAENLHRDARVYAWAVMWFASAKVVPAWPSEAAKEITESLRQWRMKAAALPAEEDEAFGVSEGLGAALEEAHALEKETSALDKALDDLEQDSEDTPSPVSAAALASLNGGLVVLEHALVRLNFVEGDVHHHDPALPAPPMPALSPIGRLGSLAPGSWERYACLVEVRRRLNRVVHELREARKAARKVARIAGGQG